MIHLYGTNKSAEKWLFIPLALSPVSDLIHKQFQIYSNTHTRLLELYWE